MYINILRQTPRQKLEAAANDFLRACGCTLDGRPVEEVVPRQAAFDISVTRYSSGNPDWLAIKI